MRVSALHPAQISGIRRYQTVRSSARRVVVVFCAAWKRYEDGEAGVSGEFALSA